MSRGAFIASVWLKRWLASWVLLAALPLGGRASTITDPQMGMEPGGDSNPFNGGTAFTPDANGGGVFYYFNNTGGTILSLTFSTSIEAGLGTDDNPALPSFTCNNASDPTAPNPFFLFCAVNYFVNDGELDFVFFGTNFGTGGVDQGIAPLENFAISLNNGYSLTVDQGGWDISPLSDPTFTATNVQTDAPEPAPAILAGFALMFGLCWSSRRHSRTG